MATLIFGDLTSNVPSGYSVTWRMSNVNLNTCILDTSTLLDIPDLTGLPVYNEALGTTRTFTAGLYRTQVAQLIRDSDQAVVFEYRFCNTYV